MKDSLWQGIFVTKLHAEVVEFFRTQGTVIYVQDLEIFEVNNFQYIPTSQKGLYMVVNKMQTLW